jgi:hypothetical protein
MGLKVGSKSGLEFESESMRSSEVWAVRSTWVLGYKKGQCVPATKSAGVAQGQILE